MSVAARTAPAIVDDDDRARLAVRDGNTMLGPWERQRCEHGRWYSQRWFWDVGSSPADGDAEIGRSGCTKCHPKDER